DASVDAFIAAVEDPVRRADALAIKPLFEAGTGQPAVMWGPSLVGFGRYRAASGDWPITGFSPRKAELVLHVMSGVEEQAELLARLGPHRTGKSCLYVKRLADVDTDVLRRIIERGVAEMRRRHPGA